MDPRDRDFDQISVGETAERHRTVSVFDIDAFANLSLDRNPLHMDESYAAQTPFQRRVAHGLLLSSWFSEIIGMELPGVRSLILKSYWQYRKAVCVGDKAVLRVKVIQKVDAVRALVCSCELFVDDVCAVDGEVLVQVR